MFHCEETRKRFFARVIMWTGWLGAFFLAALRVTELVPQNVGVLIIVFVGAAITAGQSVVRAKLSDTIIGAFQVGMRATERSAGEREARTMRREEDIENERAQVAENLADVTRDQHDELMGKVYDNDRTVA